MKGNLQISADDKMSRRCGNCLRKFQSETEKFTTIRWRLSAPSTLDLNKINRSGGKGRSDFKSKNDAANNSSNESKSIDAVAGLVMVVCAWAKKQRKEGEGRRMSLEETLDQLGSELACKPSPPICSQCHGIVQTLFNAFQDFLGIAHESSSLLKSVVELVKDVGTPSIIPPPNDPSNLTPAKKKGRKPNLKLENDSTAQTAPESKGENDWNLLPDATGAVVLDSPETDYADHFGTEADPIPFTESSQTNEKDVQPKSVAMTISSEGGVAGLRKSTRTKKPKLFDDSESTDVGVDRDQWSAGGTYPTRTSGAGVVDRERKQAKTGAAEANLAKSLWDVLSLSPLYYNDKNLAKTSDGKYICPESSCGKTFSGLTSLNRHSLSHDLDRTYHCSQCKKDFNSLLDIKTHIKSSSHGNSHSTQDSRNGSRIKTSFHSATDSNLESDPHSANLKSEEVYYKCKNCEEQFLTEKSLTKHLSVAHQESSPQGKCTACGQLFLSVHELSKHVTVFHETKQSCPEQEGKCENSTSSPATEPDTEQFKCPKCPRSFKRKQHLSQHLLFHVEAEPPLGCSLCPKKFFQAKFLRKHLLLHTTANPPTCKECNKVFSRRDHLKRHKETVHCNKPNPKRMSKVKSRHICQECGKDFSRKEYLHLHMRIHTGEKPYMCSICGNRYRDSRNLQQHLITHNNLRPFCCSVCGMTFKRAHHLADHERTHREDNVRPFVCSAPLCGKTFKLRKHLVSHELVHSGSKEHGCHVCGKAFNRKDNLRQHINKVHGKELADNLFTRLESLQSNSLSSASPSSSATITEPQGTETPVESICIPPKNVSGNASYF